MPQRRLLLDVTTVCRWLGPAAGIARVERAFAAWAHHHRSDCELVFFDPRIMGYRPLAWDHRFGLIDGDVAVDLRNVQRQIPSRPRFIERVPAGMAPGLMWVLQFRRQLLLALEARRLATSDQRWAGRLDRWQRALMTPKYRELMVKGDGARRPFLGVEAALQAPLVLGKGDVVISVGAGWNNVDIEEIARQKARDGFQLAILCQDIIPILFPQFYHPHDVENFSQYFDVAFPLADLLVFSSRSAEQDARAYCRGKGLEVRRTAITPFGANAAVAPSGRHSIADLGLDHGCYALFVSTIEPRKGHGFLLDVWRRLLADGVPQKFGFKLVLVGRPGWMVDDLLAQLRRESAETGSVVLVHDADDDMLATLYRSAAFCLYPSAYEGYGLPIVEALQHGKAVITSNAGPMAEVVDGFSPSLSPRDGEAWYRLVGQWIEDPAARGSYEADIKCRFRAIGWEEASRRFFEAIDRELRVA